MQGQRGALHRHPAALHRHGERRVDQQRHARLRAGLGLLDLDVVHLDRARPAGQRVGDRPAHVPRLGVAELPRAGRSRRLAGGRRSGGRRGRPAGRTSVSATSRRTLLPSWRMALGVRASWPSELRRIVPGVAQRLLQPLQGAGVDHGVGPELARELLQVEVVQLGALVGLGELLGQGVEVGEVLEHAGAVAEPEPVLARPCRSAPPQSSPGRRARRLSSSAPSELMRSGEPKACCASASSSSRCSRVIEFRIRCAAAARCARASSSSSSVRRLLREVLAVRRHEVVELLLGVLAAATGLQQPVEVRQHLRHRGPVLVGRVLQRLLHAGEPLVEHLPAQQVLDLLELRARLGAVPRRSRRAPGRRPRARRAGCPAASAPARGRPRPGRRRGPAACARPAPPGRAAP